MENRPCRSCKIISICCPVAIGTYLIYTGKKYEKKSKMIMNILGLGSISLGLTQIADTRSER